jgi:hypothetical protein
MRTARFEWLQTGREIHALLIFVYFDWNFCRIANEGITTLREWDGNFAPAGQ